MRTLRGTHIHRYRGDVGKWVCGCVYVHKRYACAVVPRDVLGAAQRVLSGIAPGFTYNAIKYDPKNRTVRFDEAPRFDEDREPAVGRYVTVYVDGSWTTGSSKCVWHHKWMWVRDDYDGFDVEASKAWSRTWLAAVPEVASGVPHVFLHQLKTYGVVQKGDDA